MNFIQTQTHTGFREEKKDLNFELSVTFVVK